MVKFDYPKQPCCPRFSFFQAFQNLFTHNASAVVNLCCITYNLKHLRTSWVNRWTMFLANLIWAQLGEWLCFGVQICWLGSRLWVGCRYATHVLETSSYMVFVLMAHGRISRGQTKFTFQALFTSLPFTSHGSRQVIWPNPKSKSRDTYCSFSGRKKVTWQMAWT